jgi:threonine synthase
MRAVQNERIPTDASAVAVVTGTGLKYPPVLKKFDFSPVSTKISHLSRALEAVLR